MAGDSSAQSVPGRPFTAAMRPPHDRVMQFSRTRRWFLLLCLLAAVALVSTAVFILPWKGSVPSAQESSGGSARSEVADRAAPMVPRRAREQPNPAAQQPGAPDPTAQKTAAASAESAARAAADLAASVASSN